MKRRRTGLPTPQPPDMSLPIREKSREILAALAANDVLLIMAETGSGKTTQIPQLILDGDPSADIVVTQPRRVAAITVAGRVASERGVALGEEVGYAVRFDDQSQRGVTKIRYVTDGVLLREALSNGPGGLKKRYSHVVIDEVHERSVNTDIVLGVVKETLVNNSAKNALPKNGFAARNEIFAKMIRSKLPFKVVIMSATTDSQKIIKFFKEGTSLKVGMLKVPGNLHQVQTMNVMKPITNVIDSTVGSVTHVHKDYRLPGDILVFLAGQEDIRSAIDLLKIKLKDLKTKEKKNFRLYPLYSALSPEDQMQAIAPLTDEERQHTRKIILSTNIAETSITIPGIVHVIDSGLVKVRTMVTKYGIPSETLQTEPVTRAQADQRKGRAGRTGPGKVFRLYTEKDFARLADYPKPEILRVDASSTILQILALRSSAQKSQSKKTTAERTQSDQDRNSFMSFPLIDPIPDHFNKSALETLCHLGAVNFSVQLATTGMLMSRIPVSPMLARSLLESLRVGCVDSMLSVAAVLSVEGAIFLTPRSHWEKAKAAHKRFLNPHGDHLTLLNALNAFIQLTGVQRRREFCRDHFLNYRSLVSAESIRCQLDKLMQHGDMISWGLSSPLQATVAAAIEEAGLDELVRRCLVAGFFRNVAAKRKDDGRYIPLGYHTNDDVSPDLLMDIHPSSSLRALRSKRSPGVVIYDELVRSQNGKGQLRTVVSVEMAWLHQHSTYYTQRK